MCELICQHCRKSFQAKRAHAQYCGAKCRNQAQIARRAERIKAAQEAGPAQGERYCYCGMPIPKDDGDQYDRRLKRFDQRFCSHACQQEMWRFLHGQVETITIRYGPTGFPLVLWVCDLFSPQPWELE